MRWWIRLFVRRCRSNVCNPPLSNYCFKPRAVDLVYSLVNLLLQSKENIGCQNSKRTKGIHCQSSQHPLLFSDEISDTWLSQHCSNGYCYCRSWMNQTGLTAWDVTPRLKWNGADYSAVCDRLIESGGRLQHLCSGLGRSGVKLNRKQKWIVQYKNGSALLHV